MTTHKLAIVDDEESVRDALQRTFARCKDIQVVASCHDGESALRHLPACAPDVVLMDIFLPGLSGIDCLRALKVLIPKTQIIMLTGYGDDDVLFNALAAGATGYLLKPSGPPEILAAIQDVCAGGAPMSAGIARRVITLFVEASRTMKRPAHVIAPNPEFAGLSVREKEVLHYLAEGVSLKELAVALNISWDTVRTHIKAIYEKLHVHSRTEAILKYLGREGEETRVSRS